MDPSSPPRRERKPRADGARSRQAILDTAVRLASVEGLEGLSIGVLATRLGMSKSGLYAHFGSKEDLELAVVNHAAGIVRTEVMQPAQSAPPGVSRLVAHCEAYLSYLERRVFPGGCFFAALAAEFDSRSGPVHEAVVTFVDELDAQLAGHLHTAQANGELPGDMDIAQVAFEVGALLAAANAGMLLRGSDEPIHRARSAIERTLTHASAS
jgi:AcrR family transcriptional regulator